MGFYNCNQKYQNHQSVCIQNKRWNKTIKNKKGLVDQSKWHISLPPGSDALIAYTSKVTIQSKESATRIDCNSHNPKIKLCSIGHTKHDVNGC